MIKILREIKATLEYLSGVTEELEIPRLAWMRGSLWWSIWWALLILLTLAFSGQTSKFIYIDF